MRRLLSLLLLAPLALVGCDGSPSPAMADYVSVKGSVRAADGSPLKTATLHFKAQPGGGRDESVTVTNGEFETKVFAGKYKVAFDVDAARPNVPAKYAKFDSAGFEAEVKNGMEPLKYELK